MTIVTEAPLVYVVRANGPADLATFLAQAREAPGKLSVGSSGIGSATHLTSAYLMQKAGIELLHVPYRGAGLVMTALLAGDIDAFVGDLSIALEHIRAGTARAIGVTTAARAPLLPDVPAIGELVPGFEVPFWFGLFAAKHTAPEAVARINAELSPLAAPDSELSKRMADRGSKLVLSGPDPLEARLRAEVAQWRQVVQAAGIRWTRPPQAGWGAPPLQTPRQMTRSFGMPSPGAARRWWGGLLGGIVHNGRTERGGPAEFGGSDVHRTDPSRPHRERRHPGASSGCASAANSHSSFRLSRGSMISSTQKASAVRKGERSFCNRSSISASLASRSSAAETSAA